MRKTRLSTRSLCALALLTAASCSDGSSSGQDPGAQPQPGDSTKPGSFESDLPSASSAGHAGPREAASDNGVAAPNAGLSGNFDTSKSGSADASRVIVEADVIQVQGDRLYALSRVAGLTIIDLTDPTHMSILGRYRDLNGTPFEMYLRDGVVLAMYSGWGQYVKVDDKNYSWVQTSKVLALDVANPASIGLLGSFDVAGEVSDSRIVGDVLYVVGYQNGYCWGCDQNKPQTSILSLNVKDPHQVSKADELKYADATNTYGWSKRSITVTDQRMYVAGPQYGQNMPTGSAIQVVDISDPAGDLVEGATIMADGQISSRWQMNEYQGVLRVISQIPTWWTQSNARPSVQTFTVTSSQSVTALANTPLTIPANETLQTVQFDGPRGYAVTSMQTDPLFTIDLSDPSHPRQAGQVQVPGWLYYLAPRGNRVIGLGYDQGNAQGSLTVSVFDVTNLDTPSLLSRVNFGGSWAQLPEDQDRIQKAFKILDDSGLILVPFSGWSDLKWEQPCYSYGVYRSGTQLVDLTGDQLTLRGAAPSRGQARRAFLHSQKLLSVSDESVDAFDISNRDQPAAVGSLAIARYVTNSLALANQNVARINQDWYGKTSTLVDFVSLANVDRPDLSLSQLDLSTLIAGPSDAQNCQSWSYLGGVLSSGNQLNFSYDRKDYSDPNNPKGVRGLITVDATDATHPSVLSNFQSASSPSATEYWDLFGNYYMYGYGTAQTNALRLPNAMVYLESTSVGTTVNTVNGPATTYVYKTRIRSVDLTDPTHPVEGIVDLPQADGYSGLVVDGNNVMVSHYENTANGRARFYLDRVDLSTPSKPVVATKINVPGSLLHYDAAHGRMLMSELVRTVVKDVTAEACFARFAFADFDYNAINSANGVTIAGGASAKDAGSAAVSDGTLDAGTAVSGSGSTPPAVGKADPEPTSTCTGYTEKLHLVHFVPGGAALDDTIALAERERLSSSSMGDGRVAAVISHGYAGWYGGTSNGIAIDCVGFGPCGGYSGGVSATEPVDLLTIGGFDTGHFASARLSVANLSDPWWGFWGTPPVYAAGTRALVQSQSDAAILDMTDPTAPTIVKKVPLYSYANSMSGSGTTVLLSLGEQGVQRIDLF